jgi:hypothetical protein
MTPVPAKNTKGFAQQKFKTRDHYETHGHIFARPEGRRMMQAWADYLDGLREQAGHIQISDDTPFR